MDGSHDIEKSGPNTPRRSNSDSTSQRTCPGAPKKKKKKPSQNDQVRMQPQYLQEKVEYYCFPEEADENGRTWNDVIQPLRLFDP